MGILPDAGPALPARQSGRASALHLAIGNVCSGAVADGSKADANFGWFNSRVSCRAALWLKSVGLAVGGLVLQPVRLAVAVFPGCLDSSRRRPTCPVDRSNSDGVLACRRLPCLCLGGNNGDQCASLR